MGHYNGFDVFDCSEGQLQLVPHKLNEVDFDKTYVRSSYEVYDILRDFCPAGCRYTFTKELDGKTLGEAFGYSDSSCKLIYIPYDVYVSDVTAEISSQITARERWLNSLRNEFDNLSKEKQDYLDRQMRASPELFDKYQQIIDNLNDELNQLSQDMNSWNDEDSDFSRFDDIRRILREMDKYVQAGLTILVLND